MNFVNTFSLYILCWHYYRQCQSHSWILFLQEVNERVLLNKSVWPPQFASTIWQTVRSSTQKQSNGRVDKRFHISSTPFLLVRDLDRPRFQNSFIFAAVVVVCSYGGCYFSFFGEIISLLLGCRGLVIPAPNLDALWQIIFCSQWRCRQLTTDQFFGHDIVFSGRIELITGAEQDLFQGLFEFDELSFQFGNFLGENILALQNRNGLAFAFQRPQFRGKQSSFVAESVKAKIEWMIMSEMDGICIKKFSFREWNNRTYRLVSVAATMSVRSGPVKESSDSWAPEW